MKRAKSVVFKTIRPATASYANETWIRSPKYESIIRAAEIKFPRKIASRTKLDAVRNEIIREHNYK